MSIRNAMLYALGASTVIQWGAIAMASTPDAWDDPMDPVVITTAAIADGQSHVLLVHHEAGHGGWQLYDGSDISGQKPAVLPKAEALKLDPSLRPITDLPVGWAAYRETPTAPWVRARL